MIIALQALASAMIFGGLLLAFFGWDIVLVERGWTMVIAGSIFAAGGAVLLGISAAVSRLARIEGHLSQLQDGLPEDEFVEMSKTSKGLSIGALLGGLVGGKAAADAAGAEPADETQPSLPLFEDEERRDREEDRVTAAEWPEEKDLAAPVIPFPPRTTTPSSGEEEPDMKVPDFLLAERLGDADRDLRVTELDIAIYESGPEDRDLEEQGRDERDRRFESSSEIVSEAEPEAQTDIEAVVEETERETASEEAAVSDEARSNTVVGTYNSGENKYVMFSDGSIEAQTPSGVFHFKSLDELKEFIAAGGEESASST